MAVKKNDGGKKELILNILIILLPIILLTSCSSYKITKQGPPSKKDVEQSIAALKKGSWVPSMLEAVGILEATQDPRALPVLIETAEKGHWEVARAAALALGRKGDKKALSPLCRIVANRTWEVAQAAARALGEIGDISATNCLIQALSHKDYRIRLAAVWSLAHLRDPRALDPLIRALEDEESDIRWLAGWALEFVARPSSIDKLIQAYYVASRDWKGPLCALLRVFTLLHDPKVIPHILMAWKQNRPLPILTIPCYSAGVTCGGCDFYLRPLWYGPLSKGSFRLYFKKLLKNLMVRHRDTVEGFIYQDLEEFALMCGIIFDKETPKDAKYRIVLQIIENTSIR